MLFVVFICAGMICTFMLILFQQLTDSLHSGCYPGRQKRNMGYLLYLSIGAGLISFFTPLWNGVAPLSIAIAGSTLTCLSIAGAVWSPTIVRPGYFQRLLTGFSFLAGTLFLTLALAMSFTRIVD